MLLNYHANYEDRRNLLAGDKMPSRSALSDAAWWGGVSITSTYLGR